MRIRLAVAACLIGMLATLASVLTWFLGYRNAHESVWHVTEHLRSEIQARSLQAIHDVLVQPHRANQMAALGHYRRHYDIWDPSQALHTAAFMLNLCNLFPDSLSHEVSTHTELFYQV